MGGEAQGEVAARGIRDRKVVQTYPTLTLPFERKGGDPPMRPVSPKSGAYALSASTCTPGRSLPSSHSRKAPPAAET